MKVEYKWTKERFLEASKANYDLKMKSPKLKMVGYFGIALLLFSVYLSYSKGFYTTLIVSSILVIYWYALRWPLFRLQLSSNFKKHVAKNKTVSWLIKPESFSITSENGGGSYKWNAVTDISESDYGFLVRQYPVFYWLPKDSFESETDVVWFRDNVMKMCSVGTRQHNKKSQ